MSMMIEDAAAMPRREELARRREIAREVVREAGVSALGFFRRRAELEIEAKTGGQDVVSIADRSVEDLIRARLARAFPEDGLLGEERGLSEGRSGLTWVIDPIDGTSCFVHGFDNWCVSVALMQGGRSLLGFIFAPCRDEFFEAEEGMGATLNGAPIRTDTHATVQDCFIGLGANNRVPPRRVALFLEKLLEAGGMFVRNGSGALSLAEVACGRLGGYYEPHINIWDCAAGLCLIREAGGFTDDFTAADLLAGGAIAAAARGVEVELTALIAAAAVAEDAP